MSFAIAASTPYALGQFTALVVLGVVLGWLLLRIFARRPRNPSPERVLLTPLPPTATPSTVAPPGISSPTTEPLVDVRQSHAVQTSHPGRTDVIAAVTAAVLLVGGIVHATGGTSRPSPWTSGVGLNLRAGFLGGCQSSAGQLVDCGCAFTRITSHSPYDNPAGFETLAGPVETFIRTRDPQVLPPVYISALKDCRRTGS